MKVKAQAKRATAKQRPLFPYRALARELASQQPLPIEVYRALCSGNFRFI
jgi:hypothetical protein